MCEIGRSAVAVVLLSVGCAFTGPEPLRPAAEIAAAPLPAESLREALLALHNPLLADRPVDWSDGLDPDEAALFAAANIPRCARPAPRARRRRQSCWKPACSRIPCSAEMPRSRPAVPIRQPGSVVRLESLDRHPVTS